METECQKFYKHKIKRISISNKDDDTSYSSVTILGSASYNEQVNDLRILNPNSNDADPETSLEDIDLNNESNLDKNTLDIEAKTLNESMSEGLEHHDFMINKVTIEVEREYQEETEVTTIERTTSNDSLQPTITDVIPEKDMEILRKSLEDDNVDKNEETLCQTVDNDKKQKKNKRIMLKKSYVDFLSEDEDFAWDSTSWKETDESSSNQDLPTKKRKTSTKDGKVGEAGLKKKRINKKKVRKDARSKGGRYVKEDGTIVKERGMKTNPCLNKNCFYKCAEISEEKRTAVFKHFWELSTERKKQWIISMSSKENIKRKRSKDSYYRSNTFFYLINDGEGRRQDCLKFLMNTLDISQTYIYYTLTSQELGMAKVDGRGKCVPSNKTCNKIKESVRSFIKMLPAIPSHYCRKDSAKLYLPIEFKNIKNLYRFYKEDFISKGVDVVSEKVFRQIFNTDFNIGFHIPKKDKCLKCLRFEDKNPEDCEEMQEHLDEKVASKKRLECQRQLGKENPSIFCAHLLTFRKFLTHLMATTCYCSILESMLFITYVSMRASLGTVFVTSGENPKQKEAQTKLPL